MSPKRYNHLSDYQYTELARKRHEFTQVATSLKGVAMETQNQPSNIQLIVTLSAELHHRIEQAAAQRGLLIEEYIAEILEHNVDHMLPMNRESLEQLLQARERLMQERQGQPFEDSTEIIQQMREERSRYLADL